MKIPTTMFTQHPDHVQAPFWKKDPFISAQQELLECYHAYETFGADECMWDFEGKFADPQVFEKLVRRYSDVFLKKQIGQDVRITIRVPNVSTDQHGRGKLTTAFSCVVAAASLAQEVGMLHKPLFELILPMTTSAHQLIELKKQFLVCAAGMNSALHTPAWKPSEIQIIPLVEHTRGFRELDLLLKDYLAQHAHSFGSQPTQIRPFFAHSDTSLASGLISTVLSLKLALHHSSRVSEEYKIEVHPIVGTGSLPFRGGLRPRQIAAITAEYPGIATWTIQSAFRYDYSQKEVTRALKQLTQHSGKPAQQLDAATTAALTGIAEAAEQLYFHELQVVVPTIQALVPFVPARRERMTSMGLLGYGRTVGGHALPRAITFTGALYSLGLPPELLGVGRLLTQLKNHHPELLPILFAHYQRFYSDMAFALSHYDETAVLKLARQYPKLLQVQQGIQQLREWLEASGCELIPNQEHQALSCRVAESVVLGNTDTLTSLLVTVAGTRKALG